jgi:predicted Rossmann fold nucleotide-binding protein DprA/Smf involved in DNA uptake
MSAAVRRIAIVGCRPPKNPNDGQLYVRICAAMHGEVLALSSLGPIEIVSGGADGIDALAAVIARAWDILLIEHRPNYVRYGKRAPLERNTLIVADADEVHAWPAPWSRGTWDTIRKARAAGKPCVVHEVGR